MNDERDIVRAETIKHVANSIIDTLEVSVPDASNSELLNGTATALWWMCQAILNNADDDRETNRSEMERMMLALWKRLHYHLPGESIEVRH